MNTTANEQHVAIGFLKLQTSPVSVEKYITEQKNLILYDLFRICKPCLYCLFMSTLSVYNLINFPVGTASWSPHSLPEVLINMSKCKILFETKIGLCTAIQDWGQSKIASWWTPALSGEKLCMKGGQGGQSVPSSRVSPLIELWPLGHHCSWGYKCTGCAHSCSPDFPLHHSYCCRANISVCSGLLSSQQAKIVHFQLPVQIWQCCLFSNEKLASFLLPHMLCMGSKDTLGKLKFQFCHYL